MVAMLVALRSPSGAKKLYLTSSLACSDHAHAAIQIAEDGALRAVGDAHGDGHAVGVGDAAHLADLGRRQRVMLGVEAHEVQPAPAGQLHHQPGWFSERQPERLVGNHSGRHSLSSAPALSTAERRHAPLRIDSPNASSCGA